MVEQKLDGLTDDEAALYDRQIRLWGYESQYKLKNARILIIHMDGLGAEIAKNIILSGVKSVKMCDDKVVTEEDYKNQFFLPHQSSLNLNRAESSKARAQALNPLVHIETDSEPILEKPEDFFKDFELVVSCDPSPDTNVKIDEKCRKHNTPFYAAGVFGTFGYAFYDLNKHKFTKSTLKRTWNGDLTTTTMNELAYPSLKDALAVEIKTPEMMKFLKKVPASIFLFKVISKFIEEHGRRPSESDEDYQRLVKIRDSALEGATLPPDSFPEELLRSVSTFMPSPVCAIVGAIVSQEIIKAVTQKGEPHRNFFFFDPVKLVGHVQYVGPES